MSSFNKITIVGYLGRDPELNYSSQGTAYCKMSIATTEKRKDRAGETQDLTTWFRVTVWGRQAELANEYLAKGRQVYLEGRLRLEEYTDREGNERTSLEVSATDVQFLGRRDDSIPSAPANAGRDQVEEEEENNPPAPAKSGRKTSKRMNKETAKIDEDEIPF